MMNIKEELMKAAIEGVNKYLASSRGSQCCGSSAYITSAISGFWVILPEKQDFLFRLEEENN